MAGLLYSGAPRWSPDGKLLVFGSIVDGNDEIFTVSTSGGPVRRVTNDRARDVVASSLWRVLPSLHRWSHFAVFDQGIYFVPSIDVIGPSTLQFYDFASHTTHTVARIPAHSAPGLAIAPDRQWMLYVVHDRIASDLMLLERFR